jgi:AraC-like DNA-binding protein
VQHVEFFHKDHFERNYYRVAPPPALSHFIDFFWETDFDPLWKQYPKGFSDVLFPNIGYTYLINLGTPFIMQVEDKKFEMRTDGFLPRHKSIECHHRYGNKLFGIKFKISPVIFEKKINFAEYREYIFPLSYLLEQSIIDKVKKAATFTVRIKILSHYFQSILEKYPGSAAPIHIVSSVLEYCEKENDFTTSIAAFADKHKISTRTLQRYFEMATSLSCKKALQIMRIRKAVAHLADSPGDFHYSLYGYYDHSHFYKHLKQFLHKKRLTNLRPHLRLLETMHK